MMPPASPRARADACNRSAQAICAPPPVAEALRADATKADVRVVDAPRDVIRSSRVLRVAMLADDPLRAVAVGPLLRRAPAQPDPTGRRLTGPSASAVARVSRDRRLRTRCHRRRGSRRVRNRRHRAAARIDGGAHRESRDGSPRGARVGETWRAGVRGRQRRGPRSVVRLGRAARARHRHRDPDLGAVSGEPRRGGDADASWHSGGSSGGAAHGRRHGADADGSGRRGAVRERRRRADRRRTG